MTIPTPAFTFVDERPGWCTIDHARVHAAPGDHDADLVAFTDGSINLNAGAVEGLEVSISLAGETSLIIPAPEAPST